MVAIDDVIKMETFSALLVLCAGNSPVTGEFSSQRPVTRSFDVFFDLCLNKQLSKQSRCLWFETPLDSLWRHCNVALIFKCILWNEKLHISCQISRKFVLKDPINNTPALVQILAWYRIGNKPLSELKLTQFTNAYIYIYIYIYIYTWVTWSRLVNRVGTKSFLTFMSEHVSLQTTTFKFRKNI